MKHIHVVSKTPTVAQSTDVAFFLSLLTLGFDVATVLFSALSSVFDGLVTALTTFLAAKNTEMQ
jgi:hypothetical protein